MRLRVLVSLLLLLLSVPAVAHAKESERKLSAHLVLDTQEYTDGTNPRCSYAVFVEFPDVKGAVSYRVDVQDKDPRVNTTNRFSGPPFNDDVDGYKAPAGSHRFGGMTGGGGPAPCPSLSDFAGRFEIKKAVAILDSKPRIAGTITDADGKGVSGVSVDLGGARATTGADGGYSEVVTKGRHTVSAGKGYCAGGSAKSCQRARSVTVSKGTTTVNFTAERYELSGRIRKICDGACPANPGIPGVTVTATGAGKTLTATTDDAGRYRIDAGPGAYVVHPALDGFRFEPDQQRVKLDRDQTVDFDGCGHPPTAIAAQAPGTYTSAVHPADDKACGEHEFSAKIEKGFLRMTWHGPTECGTFASPYVINVTFPAVKIVPGKFQAALPDPKDNAYIPRTLVVFQVFSAADGTTTVVVRQAEGHQRYSGKLCSSSFNAAQDPAKDVTLSLGGR
jgi:hypothetical protein